jgi:hypothetical protein
VIEFAEIRVSYCLMQIRVGSLHARRLWQALAQELLGRAADARALGT